MKRKYIKRNCTYWGHNVRFIHTAINSDTKKIIAYYGICERCGKKVFMPTSERMDNATLRHLIDVTFQDLPKSSLPDQSTNFEIMEIYKK